MSGVGTTWKKVPYPKLNLNVTKARSTCRWSECVTSHLFTVDRCVKLLRSEDVFVGSQRACEELYLCKSDPYRTKPNVRYYVLWCEWVARFSSYFCACIVSFLPHECVFVCQHGVIEWGLTQVHSAQWGHWEVKWPCSCLWKKGGGGGGGGGDPVSICTGWWAQIMEKEQTAPAAASKATIWAWSRLALHLHLNEEFDHSSAFRGDGTMWCYRSRSSQIWKYIWETN